MRSTAGQWVGSKGRMRMGKAWRSRIERLRRRRLGGCEEHKDFELFADVKKTVLHRARHKDHAACFHNLLLGADTHARSSAHHVVDLVFAMRLLRIGPTRRQHVHADAEQWDANEFFVEFSGLCARSRNRGEIKKICGCHALRVDPGVWT